MDKKSVVLEIPEEILERGERIAAQQQISLSDLVSKLLNEVKIDGRVSDAAYEAARQRQLALMKKGLPLTNNGVIDWKREDLYRYSSD